MNLTNQPEYISAIVAIIALLISCYQARLSNKQSLFNRRLNIWITVDKLMSVYVKNMKNLEHDDGPQMAIDLLFVWLTNTTYLQSISASINHVLEADPQLKLHLKLDEMKSLAMEARFCFKGKSGDAIAEFIEAYQSLYQLWRAVLYLELEEELGRDVEIVTNPPEHMRPAFRKSIEKDEVRLYEAA